MIITEVNTFILVARSAFNDLSLNKWRCDFLIEIFILYIVNDNKKAGKPFSIADYKLLYHNAFLLNRFIETFGIKTEAIKSHHHLKVLL